MRRVFYMIACLAIGLAVGVAGGRARWRISQAVLDSPRVEILHWKATAAQQGATLLIGDSLVERNVVSVLCGVPVFNAGVSRATTADLVTIAPSLVAAAKPNAVIVAVGVNDAQNRVSPNEFARRYTRLLDGAQRPVGVVGISHIPGSSRLVDEYNRIIVRAAAQRRLVYIDPLESSEGNYFLADHIHHTPRGAAEWRRRLTKTCDR